MTAWQDVFAAAVFVVVMYGLVSELARTGGAADLRAAVRTVRLRAMECTIEVRSPEWNSMECVACAFACDGTPPMHATDLTAHSVSLSPRRVFARHHIHVHALSHGVQWPAIKLICLFVFDQRTKNEKCVGTPCMQASLHNHQLLAVESASCRLINRLTCSHLPVACITRGPCSVGRISFASATCKIPSGVIRHVVR
jgi:hypothetical protein